MKKSLLVLSVAASVAMAEVYNLGQINVQAQSADNINMFEQVITSKDIAQNNERTIAESLDNMSGVSMDDGGPRGEAKISIRGHSASRVGVYIDGVPVYVPYDGNFDFGRFLTNDIAEIDVSKGYSSVAYGANNMGGVVNIITKKPTKELEGSLRGEIIMDNKGKMARHLESISVGSKIDGFYAQLNGTYTKRDHFRMSESYDQEAGSAQPKGDRLRSEARDQKISVKAGYVADDASEIAISYAKQEGQKQHPISTDSKNGRFMDSPFWDKETFSLSAQKNFGSAYIKGLAYYDKSENTMIFYKDDKYQIQRFDPSFYDDYSAGVRLEGGLETGDNFLKVAFNYKKDSHKDTNMNTSVLDKEMEQTTISVGVEDSYKITKDLEILAGISYDQVKGDKAYDSKPNTYAGLDTISAFNPQAAVVYTLTPESKLRASVSQKTYLPSLKDRYSGGIGSKEPNPDLEREIATHYELGYIYETPTLFASANIYYSQVVDAIEGVKTNIPAVPAKDKKGNNLYKDQNQNIGTFDHKGFELDTSYKFERAKIGGNYAYVDVENKSKNGTKRRGIPQNQVFAYGQQELGAGFSFYGNIKFRNGMYDEDSSRKYVELNSFTTIDAKVIYSPMQELVLEMGIKNITDELVEYSLYYPEAGREYFATMNYKF